MRGTSSGHYFILYEIDYVNLGIIRYIPQSNLTELLNLQFSTSDQFNSSTKCLREKCLSNASSTLKQNLPSE